MKQALVVRTAAQLAPLGVPAGELSLGPTTVRARLVGQLTRLGFQVREVHGAAVEDVVAQATPGTVVASDTLFCSTSFLRAFLASGGARAKSPVEWLGWTAARLDDGAPIELPLWRIGAPEPTGSILPRRLLDVPIRVPERLFGSARVTTLPAHFAVAITDWTELLLASTLLGRERLANLVSFLSRFLPRSVIELSKRRQHLSRFVSKVGRRCRIHPTASIEGSVIGDDVEIGAFVRVQASVIGDGATIGDHASLRLSTVGRGVNLSGTDLLNCYLGDDAVIATKQLYNCVIGARTFIGGGSGFADFDGRGGGLAATIDGATRATPHALLGSAVGADCFLGAGLIFGPGQLIPSGTKLVSRLVDARKLEAGETYLWLGDRAFRVPRVML